MQLHFAWKMLHGKNCLTIDDHVPINGDSLRFKWDGTPGILVNSMYPGTWEVTDYGPAHFITGTERYQYIIHEHEPEAANYQQGDLAGSIHGIGMRGRLYWVWWLKSQVYALLLNYLERFANGITLAFYDAENDKAKEAMATALKEGYNQFAFLIPQWNNTKTTNGIQRLEAGTASPALLQQLVTSYFDDIITQTIIGQTLSSDTAATGLGSGVADLHGDTLARIIKYDAVNLAATYQRDLVNMLYKYNCPGVEPGIFTFEVDSPNSEEVLNYATQLFQMGLPLDGDQLYEVGQLKKPTPGSTFVS